ncbi:TPR repeat [Selenomonas ruminantium]|uniref:TPR repeat n=1 Tax=Selenomonas ruminantium TaxID=971 RepID=A0A1M6TNY7_SELRU|nr:tetratricopeptide repeat protein [Selenomonas ruminantium]SHK58681.1 TPR repeat [Selenomonas ruminantium]
MQINYESPWVRFYQRAVKYLNLEFDEKIFIEECLPLFDSIRSWNHLDSETLNWVKSKPMLNHYSIPVIDGMTKEGIMRYREKWLDDDGFGGIFDQFISNPFSGFHEISEMIPCGTLVYMLKKACQYYDKKCKELCKKIDELKSIEEMLAEKEKMASSGDVGAMVFLGDAYHEGMLCRRDVKKSFKYYQMAAESNSADGWFGMARCYSLGECVETNAEKAITLYEKAASNGNCKAMLLLGSTYLGGGASDKTDKVYIGNVSFDREYDFSKVKFWYDKAIVACGDDKEALALCYHRIAADIQYSKNKDELSNIAEEYHRKAADLGNVGSMLDLLRIYDIAESLDDDFMQKYKRWLDNVVEESGLKTIGIIGAKYIEGSLVTEKQEDKKNKIKAEFKWLNEKAKASDGWAAFTLGNICYYGYGAWGVRISKAYEYYKLASDSVNPVYSIELGDMYWQKKIPCVQRRNSAIKCYYMSLINGNGLALKRLEKFF